MVAAGETPELTWLAHAEGLRRDLLALEAVQAMIADDPQVMEDFIARLDALAAGEDGAEQIDELLSAIAYLAAVLGRHAHGDRLPQVLRKRHEDTLRHIAAYDPERER